jgi:hypothetical protein
LEFSTKRQVGYAKKEELVTHKLRIVDWYNGFLLESPPFIPNLRKPPSHIN